jgi:hypothetical protein
MTLGPKAFQQNAFQNDAFQIGSGLAKAKKKIVLEKGKTYLNSELRNLKRVYSDVVAEAKSSGAEKEIERFLPTVAPYTKKKKKSPRKEIKSAPSVKNIDFFALYLNQVAKSSLLEAAERIRAKIDLLQKRRRQRQEEETILMLIAMAEA